MKEKIELKKEKKYFFFYLYIDESFIIQSIKLRNEILLNGDQSYFTKELPVLRTVRRCREFGWPHSTICSREARRVNDARSAPLR